MYIHRPDTSLVIITYNMYGITQAVLIAVDKDQ